MGKAVFRQRPPWIGSLMNEGKCIRTTTKAAVKQTTFSIYLTESCVRSPAILAKAAASEKKIKYFKQNLILTCLWSSPHTYSTYLCDISQTSALISMGHCRIWLYGDLAHTVDRTGGGEKINLFANEIKLLGEMLGTVYSLRAVSEKM